MRFFSLLAPALPVSFLFAQANTGVHDVGLTMANSPATSNVVAGQRCGAFTCVPFPGNTLSTAASLVRTVSVYGDANSLFILLLSLGPVAAPCQAFPGIGNALILGQPLTTLAIGVTGPYLPSTSVACRQGVGTWQLTLPVVSPNVIPFRLQALTFSFTTQAPAFTIAIQGTAH